MADQSVMRKGEADFDEIRKLANQYYVKADYTKALANWQLLLNGQKTIQSDYLYMAICHLKLGESNLAIQQLNQIESKKGIELEWNWVISIAYLKSNQIDKAKIHLSYLVKKGKYKVKEAEALLAKI